MTRTEEHLCFRFCPRCARYFSAGGDPQTDVAILNYWSYKNRHGFRAPVEPILVPIVNIYQPVKADYTDAYLLHRLELSALATAVHEDTVRKWVDKEINKDGRVVEEWSLISALSHIRQETLAQAFARQFVQPLSRLARNPSPTAPPGTAKERRALRNVKANEGSSSLSRGNPSHIIARMEICGNADGMHSPFIVHVDGYRRQNMEVASQAMGLGEFGETELQQLDSDEPRSASRLSNLFVVGDDSDDDGDSAEDTHVGDLHNMPDIGRGDAASDDNTLASPVRIVSRHKAILCSIRHVPSLRASLKRQRVVDDKPSPNQMSFQALTRSERETAMTPTIVTVTPTLEGEQALCSLSQESAYLPDLDSGWAASSPLLRLHNGKYSIEFDGKSLAVTDTFVTPEKPTLDYKPVHVLPDKYLCDDVSGYDSGCDDGNLTALPLTADKLVNVAKRTKHLNQAFGVAESRPKIINNIKALRPGRKAYQDYPRYTVSAWDEDLRNPATIPTVLRMSSPEAESQYLTNQPACTTPPTEAWVYTDAVKAITHRLGVALRGKDRPLVYGLMRMPPQKRRFVMDGLVNLFDSAKAVMGRLPPRTPSPPWLGRDFCQSPLPMTPVQAADVGSHVEPKDAQLTSYRTYPRRPVPPASDQVPELDSKLGAEDARIQERRASVPLPFTPSPDLDVEQRVCPENASSVEDGAYRTPTLSSTPVQLPEVDNQSATEYAEVMFTGHSEHEFPPLPFTPSPDLGTVPQTVPMDVFSTIYRAYQPPPSRSGWSDADVSSDTDRDSGDETPPSACL